VGHIWTVFAGFRGGKGIATAAGMLIGIAPTEFAICVAVFFIVFLAWKYVSLSSIAAAVTFPISMFLRQNVFGDEIQSYKTLFFFGLAVAVLLVYSHRANIKRLLEGTEKRITRASPRRSSET
jgi:glycerol-3-phosphate acyltransferase PlsY